MDAVDVRLTSEEALVLFDWLSRFNETGSSEFVDQAEERVLFDLEASLESELVEVLRDGYQPLLEAARAAVRDR